MSSSTEFNLDAAIATIMRLTQKLEDERHEHYLTRGHLYEAESIIEANDLEDEYNDRIEAYDKDEANDKDEAK